MPSRTVDAIVLGAGIVGVSAAVALQARGRTVALVDRLREAAGETSFGNSGIVQTEGVLPYLFPRAPGDIARAGVEPRSTRPYALWRAAFDRARDLALFPGFDAAEKGCDR